MKAYTRLIAPLSKQSVLAYFEATQTGRQEAYECYAISLAERFVHADKDAFERLKGFKDPGRIQDPILLRQLALLHKDFLSNQVPSELLERITRQESLIEEAFGTFSYKIDGERVSNHQMAGSSGCSRSSRSLRRTFMESSKPRSNKPLPKNTGFPKTLSCPGTTRTPSFKRPPGFSERGPSESSKAGMPWSWPSFTTPL
ncbi:MAG: hypothetical protein SVK44_08680 [Nitrospirota bacterium]|nr:hypothetical protein [Nitrospirota bacterium]